jgi:hypothetical protein
MVRIVAEFAVARIVASRNPALFVAQRNVLIGVGVVVGD